MVTAIQVPQDLSGLKIGILGLQGAFVEHLAALKRVEPSIESIIIREPSQLDESLDGIIIPGGESTTMTIVAQNYGLFPGLKEWVSSQKPIMVKQYSDEIVGTKAGGQPNLGGLSCRVHRNYYGSQAESFIAPIKLLDSSLSPYNDHKGVFIRAPYIESIFPNAPISILATLIRGEEEEIVAIRQGNTLGITFHPELTDSPVWHRYFLTIVKAQKISKRNPE